MLLIPFQCLLVLEPSLQMRIGSKEVSRKAMLPGHKGYESASRILSNAQEKQY